MSKPKVLPPDEVLALAERAEQRTSPEIHPQLGIPSDGPDDAIDEVRGALGPGGLPAIPPPPRGRPARLSTYCDSCGHVDDHAHDCPQRVALEAQAEAAREEALERAERGDRGEESIGTLVRQLGATMLRRLARVLDGR